MRAGHNIYLYIFWDLLQEEDSFFFIILSNSTVEDLSSTNHSFISSYAFLNWFHFWSKVPYDQPWCNAKAFHCFRIHFTTGAATRGGHEILRVAQANCNEPKVVFVFQFVHQKVGLLSSYHVNGDKRTKPVTFAADGVQRLCWGWSSRPGYMILREGPIWIMFKFWNGVKKIYKKLIMINL